MGFGQGVRLRPVRYRNPPVYITENGVSANPAADAPLDEALDDESRVKFISGYLKARSAPFAARGRRGYFCWSFFDNFEWAEGAAAVRPRPRGPPRHVRRRVDRPPRETFPRILPRLHDRTTQRGAAAAAGARRVVPAGGATYGGEPLPWETATHRERTAGRAADAPARWYRSRTRRRAAATSTSSAARRVAALGGEPPRALGDATAPPVATRRARLERGPDTDERAADARRRDTRGWRSRPLKALTQARRSAAPGRTPSPIGSCPTPLRRSDVGSASSASSASSANAPTRC